MHNTSSKQLSSTKLWMVSVGVNHYQDSFIPNLKYCANDCEELAEALTIATKQFKEAEIIALHDGGIKPSLEEVVDSIKKLRLAQPEDTILFYFSGHGELDRDNQPVLGVTDTRVIKNEADNILSFDPETGLKLDRLLEEFRNSPAQSQLIWLDACQAKAEINGEQNNANGQIIAALNQESQQTRPGKNFFAMLSCDQTELSWEFDELGHGLFTYSLIKGLQGNAANAEGKIGVNSLFNYVKNNIAEYLKLKKHPVTTEAANNSAKGLVIKPTKQVKRFPANVYQNPRKIDSSGEVDLIIGAVAPANSRKALICDRLSSSLTDIEFCRLLQDRGGFTVEHCFLEAKTEKNLAEAIAGYLQDKDNETVLLYLAGEIEKGDRAEYSLAVNPKSKVNLNWLGGLIRDSPVKEAIVIVDVIERQNNYPDIRDILNPDANRSLCIIAASNIETDRKLIAQLVEILTVAAEADQQFWAATMITQLQKKADFLQELKLQKPGLYSSSTAINILLPKSRRSNKQTYDLNISPYKSLQAFTQDDAYFFHGREALIAEILEKLATNPFLAVVGASGSGKSSVVRAGVVPQLTAVGLYSPQSDEYLPCKTYVMRPGDNPLTALATALAANDPELAEGFLHIGVDSFISWLQQQPQTISILVIDQFEELFTTKHKSQSNSFIEFILQAIALSPDCFKVIITLRDDFLKDCLANQKIDPLFRQSHILVRPYLKEDEYRQILKQPAQKVGLTIEDELVNVLLQELQTESLPLLQFALDELWRKRTPGELTLANYQENIGGLGAILGKKAESTLNGLNKEQQECAQAIFQDLVQLGEGKEDTRRRVSKRKLAKTKHQAVFNSTLKALVDARLLVIGLDNNTLADNAPNAELENQSRDGETTVEIAHEILIRNWDTLRWWLDTNRNQIRLTRELEQKAEEWVNTPKDKKDDFLLSEASLIKYQDLYCDRADELSNEVNQFVRLSIEKCDRLKQEEEKRRNRELAQERKARINAQRFIRSLLGGLAISLGLTGIAGWQWHKSRINEINSLTNTAEALLASNQEFDALITGLRAGKLIENTIFGVDTETKIRVAGELQNIFYRVKEFNRLDGYIAEPSPDGRIIATADYDATVKLWNLKGQLLHTLKGDESLIHSIAFDPNGNTIATASVNGKINFWNLEGKLVKTLRSHEYIVKETRTSPQIAFSPDGKYFIHYGLDGEIKIWNRQGEFELLKQFKVSDYPLSEVKGYLPIITFTSDSQTFVTNSLDNTLKLWTIEGDLLQTFRGHTGIIKSIAISPDNKAIASATYDGEPKLWNLEGKLLADITDHKDANNVFFVPYNNILKTPYNTGLLITESKFIGKLKFWNSRLKLLQTINGFVNNDTDILLSSDNKTLAFSQGNEIRILNLDQIDFWNGQPRFFNSLQSHKNKIRDVDFYPNGKTVISVGENYGIRIWSLDRILLKTFLDPKYSNNSVQSMAFSPDGKTIAFGHFRGEITVWNLEGKLLNTFEGHSNGSLAQVNDIAFSSDGKIIASASSDRTIKLWNLKGELLNSLENHNSWVKSVAFSPNGKLIASAGWDKTINLYDMKGERINSFTGDEVIESMAFSPNGKTIVTAGREGIIRLWNLEGESLRIVDNARQSTVNDIAFSPDGKMFASVNSHGLIKIWNQKGKLLRTFSSDANSLDSVTFFFDGKFIASGSSDGKTQLWNTKGELLQTLRVSSSYVKDIVFHPKDSKVFASSGISTNTSVNLLSLDLDDVMSRGCDWAGDYLANNPNVSEEDRKICDDY